MVKGIALCAVVMAPPEQTRNIDLTSGQCWAVVGEDDPAVPLHCVNISFPIAAW